jgi:hypothetical protein
LQIIEWLVAFLCVDEKYEIGNVDGSFFLHIDLQELALYVARRGVHLEVQCNNSFLTLHPSFLYHQRHLGLVVLSPLLPNLG